MTVYALAQFTIHNRERYNRYVSNFADLYLGKVVDSSAPFGGALLVAEENPQTVEGVWPFTKVILISFPDKKTFSTWMNSEAYQQISKDREAGTEGSVLLLQGLG